MSGVFKYSFQLNDELLLLSYQNELTFSNLQNFMVEIASTKGIVHTKYVIVDLRSCEILVSEDEMKRHYDWIYQSPKLKKLERLIHLIHSPEQLVGSKIFSFIDIENRYCVETFSTLEYCLKSIDKTSHYKLIENEIEKMIE